MIRMRIDFYAESLGMGTSMVVLYPQEAAGIGMGGAAQATSVGTTPTPATSATPTPTPASPGVPALYLLHGLSDDCTIWERRTAIERYASEAGIAVVMPEVRRSFYTDEAVGEAYWTFISQELPALLARTLRISTAREDTFVAGLSMGGYGAFKLALNHPERFAAAASLSGALDIAALLEGPEREVMAQRILGGRRLEGSPDDVMGLLRTVDPQVMPRLFLDCGTEDPLAAMNREAIAIAQERGLDLSSRMRPGNHTWDFWDQGIQDVLAWLPRRA